MPTAPRWMSVTLILAGWYNLIWGAAVVIAPHATFEWSGLALPDRPLTYPSLWQCLGMVIGVYGIGYLIAAGQPLRHWPIVLVGLLGKLFGPLGFAIGVTTGEIPWQAVRMLALNDLIWWIPFALILWRTLAAHVREEGKAPALAVTEAMEKYRTQQGETLAAMSARGPLLLVFLRHLGCPFCREAVADVAARRQALTEVGTPVVFVHMTANDADAERFFAGYGLADLPRVSDPTCELYRAFGLQRAGLAGMFGRKVIARGYEAHRAGHRVASVVGDVLRLGGVFLVDQGRILQAQRLADVGERPDYVALATCARPQAEATA